LAGFKLEILAPEPGAPGDQIGAAYLAVRAVAPDGRSFCDFSDLDVEAQTVAATRLKNACSNLLLPAGGRSRLSPELERIALDAWRQELVSDFGLETLDGAGLAPARLQDAVLQAPFLDPYRVVFVRMLPGNRAEGLVAAVAEIPATTRLLVTVAGRISSANKLAKAITAAGGKVEEMQHLNRRSLSEWAAKRAVEKHGLAPAVAAQVVRVSPPDLSIVDSELTKLAAYKASGAKLTPDAIAELLAGGRED